MVRPNVATLNSLAAILRQAMPLYAECKIILNALDSMVDTTGLEQTLDVSPRVRGAESPHHSAAKATGQRERY
jgi:hypothetical protein